MSWELILPAITAVVVAIISLGHARLTRRVNGWERKYRSCRRRLARVEKRLKDIQGLP